MVFLSLRRSVSAEPEYILCARFNGFVVGKGQTKLDSHRVVDYPFSDTESERRF